MSEIVGLSKKLEFVGKLPNSDKPWHIERRGKRFFLLNDDHPTRIISPKELREVRQAKAPAEDLNDDSA